jgi:hypothetical protein
LYDTIGKEEEEEEKEEEEEAFKLARTYSEALCARLRAIVRSWQSFKA